MSQESTASSSSVAEQKRSRNSSDDDGDNRPTKYPKADPTIDEVFRNCRTLKDFCIGGKTEFDEKTSKFFYKATDGSIHCIDFLNPSKEEIDALIKRCSESPFGFGGQSIVNPDVRQAKELRDFAFQFSPDLKSSICSEIKKFLGNREFIIQPYKLNVYSEGGHFKRHKDTLKNEKMIASLVICLPIAFEGGILTVENERGQSVSFDWGKEIDLMISEKNIIQWACFFCSCDHFISKVSKGNRITVSYDIFVDDSKQKPSNKSNGDDDEENGEDVPELYHSYCIKELQKCVNRLDASKVYGYFPNHTYSFGTTEEEGNDLRVALKGNDLLLYDVLVQAGWNVTLQVYYPEMDSYGPYIECFKTEEDGESAVPMEKAMYDDDKKNLTKIKNIELLNPKYLCKKKEIHEYYIAYGYTGNSPVREDKYFYAGTIMIFRHQTNPTENKDD